MRMGRFINTTDSLCTLYCTAWIHCRHRPWYSMIERRRREKDKERQTATYSSNTTTTTSAALNYINSVLNCCIYSIINSRGGRLAAACTISVLLCVVWRSIKRTENKYINQPSCGLGGLFFLILYESSWSRPQSLQINAMRKDSITRRLTSRQDSNKIYHKRFFSVSGN